MAAGLHAFEDQGVGSVAEHALGDREGGGEAHDLGSGLFDLDHLVFTGETPGKHDEGQVVFLHQGQVLLVEWGDGDQVDAKGFVRQLEGFLNLLLQDLGWCVTPGQAAKTARIGHGRDQFWVADPGHGAAHNGGFDLEKIPAPLKKTIRVGFHNGPSLYFYSITGVIIALKPPSDKD